MGLDQYAGLRSENGEILEKFYWRKHARLQQFFSEMFALQKNKIHENHLGHLGFNAGEGGVKIDKDILQKLKEAYEENYYRYFVSDGFFWGQQYQEESLKEYKEQDKEFIDWCEKQLDANNDIGYDCSW